MAEQAVIVAKLGAVCPVGLGAAQTATSVRAGIARFAESPIHPRILPAFTLALVPEEYLQPLAPELQASTSVTTRRQRMLRLAGPALHEASEGCDDTPNTPLFLGMPVPQSEQAPGPEFLRMLVQQSGVAFDVERSLIFPNGRAAGLLALKEAVAYIEQGEGPFALVGGVDTFFDAQLLSTLDEERRVTRPGVMDGFIPGEGAAFLLVASADSIEGLSDESCLRIYGVGTGTEPGHRYADEPYKGDGLASSLESLSADLGDDVGLVRTVFSSFNGEGFWAKEWGTAYIRHSTLFEDGFAFEHPADCFGDTGAAMGPLMICLAQTGVRADYLHPPVLVWCSSDHEERACAYFGTLQPENA